VFLLEQYIKDISRLQASENLERIMEVAVGSGTMKGGKEIRRKLVREAQMGTEKVSIDPTTLASIGIGFERCQKN
jgi:CO dehydrogenase/acetyl-CoA synthase delta subunit